MQPLGLVLTFFQPLRLIPPWASGIAGASIQSLHTSWALLGMQVHAQLPCLAVANPRPEQYLHCHCRASIAVH